MGLPEVSLLPWNASVKRNVAEGDRELSAVLQEGQLSVWEECSCISRVSSIHEGARGSLPSSSVVRKIIAELISTTHSLLWRFTDIILPGHALLAPGT